MEGFYPISRKKQEFPFQYYVFQCTLSGINRTFEFLHRSLTKVGLNVQACWGPVVSGPNGFWYGLYYWIFKSASRYHKCENWAALGTAPCHIKIVISKPSRVHSSALPRWHKVVNGEQRENWP